MRGWSLSVGRYFGVDVRLHALFVLLMPGAMLVSSALNGSALRGLALWLLLLVAVLVRETGRGLMSAASGGTVTRLVLLPTGAAPTLEEGSAPMSASRERLLALAGPLSNFFVGITMALLMYAATSRINLFERPWFGPSHLLRSAIWSQVLLGGLNLLPAYPLDAGIVLRRQFRRIRGDEAGMRAAAGVTQAVALLLVMAGFATTNGWLTVMGCSILLSGRADGRTALAASGAANVAVGEVMLREFSTLSASDTLQDAAARCVQSVHDVFPVVRGPLVVGAVSRETVMAALRTGGNGYVQGHMTRTVFVASPDDPLMPTLNRLRTIEGPQLLNVVRDDQLVGIVTPGNLAQSLAMVARIRRLMNRDAQASRS